MTKRQLARKAFDPVHKRLMFEAHDARGGQKGRSNARLVSYVAACLEAAVRRRRRARR